MEFLLRSSLKTPPDEMSLVLVFEMNSDFVITANAMLILSVISR